MDRCQVPHRSINNASPGLRFCDSVVHRLVTDTTRAYCDRTQRWLRAVLSCGLCCDSVRYCAILCDTAGRSLMQSTNVQAVFACGASASVFISNPAMDIEDNFDCRRSGW
jgi:hypothetical protein